MFDLIRGAAAMFAVLVGSVLDTHAGSVLALVSLAVLIGAAVVATRRAAPVAVDVGTQQVFALRARAAVLVRKSRSAPTLRRRHRARAPGRAA